MSVNECWLGRCENGGDSRLDLVDADVGSAVVLDDCIGGSDEGSSGGEKGRGDSGEVHLEYRG